MSTVRAPSGPHATRLADGTLHQWTATPAVCAALTALAVAGAGPSPGVSGLGLGNIHPATAARMVADGLIHLSPTYTDVFGIPRNRWHLTPVGREVVAWVARTWPDGEGVAR